MEDKYKTLKLKLEALDCDNFNGSLTGASYYYFRVLEELSLDILIDDNEVKT